MFSTKASWKKASISTSFIRHFVTINNLACREPVKLKLEQFLKIHRSRTLFRVLIFREMIVFKSFSVTRYIISMESYRLNKTRQSCKGTNLLKCMARLEAKNHLDREYRVLILRVEVQGQDQLWLNKPKTYTRAWLHLMLRR